MTTPARIQLRRTKGWRLQAASQALNGLPAVKVDRTTLFGNPFQIVDCIEAGFGGTQEQLAARCVAAFRVWVDSPHWRENWSGAESETRRRKLREALPALRGKNLACWCAPGAPCHADVLLDIANLPICEEVK